MNMNLATKVLLYLSLLTLPLTSGWILGVKPDTMKVSYIARWPLLLHIEYKLLIVVGRKSARRRRLVQGAFQNC